MAHVYLLASFPGHSQILSQLWTKLEFSPQLQDKIWEWPGNEAIYSQQLKLMFTQLCHSCSYSYASLITSFQPPLECQYCSTYISNDRWKFRNIYWECNSHWVWIFFFPQPFFEQHSGYRVCCSQCSPAGVQRASKTGVSMNCDHTTTTNCKSYVY